MNFKYQLGILANLTHEAELKAVLLSRPEVIRASPCAVVVSTSSHIVIIETAKRIKAHDVVYLSGLLAGYNLGKKF